MTQGRPAHSEYFVQTTCWQFSLDKSVSQCLSPLDRCKAGRRRENMVYLGYSAEILQKLQVRGVLLRACLLATVPGSPCFVMATPSHRIFSQSPPARGLCPAGIPQTRALSARGLPNCPRPAPQHPGESCHTVAKLSAVTLLRWVKPLWG